MKTGRPSTCAVAPYRLHGLLRRYGIAQGELRRAITVEAGLRAGQPIADSTLSALLVRRVWPSSITAESLVAQVGHFLHERGLSAAEIADAWAVDGDEPDDGPPLGRPLLAVGQRRKTESTEPDHDSFRLPEADMLSPAARDHFKLFRSPFVDDVTGPQDVFLSADQRYVRDAMYYCAKHGGLMAVIGESGAGKSTLRRDLVERIKRGNEGIVIIQP